MQRKTKDTMPEPDIAVLIPCFNEEQTVALVVQDFQTALPQARIFVYDNNSTDGTAKAATAAGAIVIREPRQGKGNVVRSMFRQVDADVFIMADGDATYFARDVQPLLDPVLTGQADMVCGDRLSGGDYQEATGRSFHQLGNNLIRWLINTLFQARLHDITTGYRVMSREFVKNFPVVSQGFEIETAMTIHALHRGWRVEEIPVGYGKRPEGSESKLRTFRDGFRVITTLFSIFKDYKPLPFFSGLALLFFLAGLIVGIGPVSDYLRFEYVHKIPSAVLASSLELVALCFFFAGLILDTNVKHFAELYQLHLQSYHLRERLNGKPPHVHPGD